MTGSGSDLTVGVLGDLVAYRGPEELDLGGRQQRAVLARLVLARGDVVLAEQIVDALWGEDPPRSATSTLHSHVSRLRARLDDDATESVLVRQGPGYRLGVPTDAIDAWRFERLLNDAGSTDDRERVRLLTASLALWRGPALADYATEPWAYADAVRLDALREVAKEQLIGARLEIEDAAVMVPELERLVADDQLREERWRLLALALYRGGRQADALAAIRRAREVLADELGVDPGLGLRQLEADVLAQSPSLDVRRTEIVVAEARRTDGDLLVDRDAELADLAQAIDAAKGGIGSVVVIEGPAGIGKSRLLAEARRLAQGAGMAIADARGSRLERGFAYGAVRQLLEPSVADGTLLEGPRKPAAVVFDLAGDPDSTPDGFGILQALQLVLVAAAAQTPLLLAVDDIQWCDPCSLRFLTFVHRRIAGMPVVLLATLRTGEADADDVLLHELVDDATTVLVRPQPLSPEATAEVVRSRLGPDAAPAFVAACQAAVGGNPLLLRQLLRALEAERVAPDAIHASTVTAVGSRAVSSMVLLRLKRMPPTTSDVARALAVLGDGAELPTVAALAELPESEVREAVAALARAEVLRADYPLGFVHPVVADAIGNDLAPGTRAYTHERAARILESAGAAPEQVAAHLLLAPRRADPWTVDVLLRAADRAGSRGAPEAVATYVRRATEEPAGPELQVTLLVRLAMALVSSDGPAAQEVLRTAYDLAEDPGLRADIALQLTGALVFLGERGEATRFATREAAGLDVDELDRRQALSAAARVASWIHQLPPDQWQVGADEVPGDGPGGVMLAVAQAWELCVRGVEREHALELVRFALAHESWDETVNDLFADVAGMVLMVAGEDAGPLFDSALSQGRRRGEVLMVGIHMWRGIMLYRDGSLREAEQSLLTAWHQTEDWGSANVGVPYCLAGLVLVNLDLGELEQARSLVETALKVPAIGDGARLVGEAHASVLLAEGRPAEALALLEELLAEQVGLVNPAAYPARRIRAHALHALGRRDEALGVLADQVSLARTWGARDVLGGLLAELGALADDEDVSRQGVEMLRDTRAELPLGRACATLARLTADPTERSALWQQAIVIADRCGSEPLRRKVAAAMTAVGVAVPDAPPPARMLSRLERRSALLVTSGRGVDDVARELFVTPRTVAAAVDSARRRVGVHSDAELAAALARS